MAKKADQQTTFLEQLIISLAGNSQVYKGTAEDASKILRLAQQIIAEIGEALEAGF